MAAIESTARAHNFKDLRGQTFGRLTALCYQGGGKWLCRCICGREKLIRTYNLTSATIVSCGCYRNERIRETCGGLKSLHPAEYDTWCGVKRRCLNTNEPGYKTYGGAGVTICDEWRDSFAAFFAAMGPKPTPAHTIDRIKNERGYETGNCRWATRREQAQNTRKATTLTIDGATKPTPDWAREYGIRLQTLHARLQSGWDAKRALTTPVETDETLAFNGETKTISEWARVTGIRVGTIRHRIRRGWNAGDALTVKPVRGGRRV